MSQESYECFNCEYSRVCDMTVDFECPYEDDYYEDDEDW